MARRGGGRTMAASWMFFLVVACLVMEGEQQRTPFFGLPLPPAGLYCSPYNDMTRLTFRRIQDVILKRGWETTFDDWDGIDDSVPDSVLSWKELGFGLRALPLFDNWGTPVVLTGEEVEGLLREFNDDDTDAFKMTNWGSSFYDTDASDYSALETHNDGRPVNQMDGNVDNALCKSEDGVDYGVCNRISKDMFRKTIEQISDTKYSQNCNGHGICDNSIGFCICDKGWTGFNCSLPEVPCNGLVRLQDNFGSFSSGYGRDRKYGFNLNCTWVIQPPAMNEYGLPTVLIIKHFATEPAFDVLTIFEGDWADQDRVVTAVDGILPGGQYAMPELFIIPGDKGATIQFVSDGSTSENGFTIMYGMPFDMKYVFAVRNPLMSTPCGRKFKTSEASRCQNENCDNCGISLDERADGVVNPVTGNFDNMCYIGSRQNSEVTHINDPIDGETLVGQYDECAKTVEKVLTHVAGDRVKMTVKCPRGSSLFAIDKTKLHDKPEYILGPGPPQFPQGRFPQGMAHQLGFIFNGKQWYDDCDPVCRRQRLSDDNNVFMDDEVGRPGPVLAAVVYARETSKARQLSEPWTLFPANQFTGEQYGYPFNEPDQRTPEQLNSAGIRAAFSPEFTRCKDNTNPKCDFGSETCSVEFTPTIPGVYQAEFYNIVKYKEVDEVIRPIPFTAGHFQRTVIVMPGPTSAGHSHAHGPGLDFAFASRSGLGSYFWIDSYDRFENPRLTGGDQWNVAMVAPDKGTAYFARVTNVGNGSYYVGFNITVSGRYTVSITLKDDPDTLECFNGSTTVPLLGTTSLANGQQRCHAGTMRMAQIEAARGKEWCPTKAGEIIAGCDVWTFQNPGGLSPRPPMSPYSAWIDSGPTGTDTIQAFGLGISAAIAGYPAFFYLRIRDVYGNWASQKENVSITFTVPQVAQQLTNSTTPTSADAHFAGDEFWQGDYSVNWMPIISGHHSIAVRVCNPTCNHIAGSPFNVLVEPSPTFGPNSTAHGSGTEYGTVGESRIIEIQDRDNAGNKRTLGGEEFNLRLTGISTADCPFIQEHVLHDITCRCPDIYKLDMSSCRQRPLQEQPGAVISPNMPANLSCLYLRNDYSCPTDCCPNGTMMDGCSDFNYPPEFGESDFTIACPETRCAQPIGCKHYVTSQQELPQEGNLFKTFLNTAMRECPQIERLGLEASVGFTGHITPWVLPPDPMGTKSFNLLPFNLDPQREIWRGAMTDPEIQLWIAARDLSMLYYTRAGDTNGPYFSEYGDSTGPKSEIEGFVDEMFSTLGERDSLTSRGTTMAGMENFSSTAVGLWHSNDHDDGRYTIHYNVTRAGFYSLSIQNGGQELHMSPYTFLVRPQVFEPKNAVIMGTGASKNKDLLSGEADYKGAITAGKFVNFELRLRDRYWNYLWVSRPEEEFSIYFEPMRIRYFDTSARAEAEYSWPATFRNYTMNDYGDANYRVDYIVTTAGTFPLKVRLVDDSSVYRDLDKSPYMIVVRPDKVDISSSTAFGKGLKSCGAGLVCSFAIETRDKWGNRCVLPEDEGPYCHTWNPNLNNGGSGGNDFTPVFQDQGCTPGVSCTTRFTTWSQSSPASGPVVNGPPTILPYPAQSNEVAYLARGGVLHDCVPIAPFDDPNTYNERASCNSSSLGPCGIYDQYGRTEQPIYNIDGVDYTWFQWRAAFPDRRGRYVGFIPNAEPQRYQQFDTFVDEMNNYAGSFNITKAGEYNFALVYFNQTTQEYMHISGSPFKLEITGGLTTPQTCIGYGQGMFSAQVGYPATFTVLARDRFGNPRTLGREKVEVFIQGNNVMQPIPVKTLDRLNGMYHIEYNATVTGTYSMSVSILEHDIPGSPFRIEVQKGFHLPFFNNSWGLNYAGDAELVSLQGPLECFSGAQGCVSAVRLTKSEKNSTGAVWYNTMQRVELGFEATFSFRINELSQHCKTAVVIEERCMERGGDGIAFVIHENGYNKALGADGASIGYGGIDNSIAVEFDTWYNADLGDVYQNHVAVHTLGRQPNTPSSRSRLAGTVKIPNLADGNRHTARIRYENWMEPDSVTDESWSPSPYSLDWLQFGSGVLKVYLDDLDRPILSLPIIINNTLALMGGHAWVGVTASTGVAQQAQHVYSFSYQDSLCRDDCNYKGKCVDGQCHCEVGFYGPYCQFILMISDRSDKNLCPVSNLGQGETFSGSSNCSCPPGFQGPLGGPCYSCPVDSYKPNAGDMDCIPCPANSATFGVQGVAEIVECRCKRGYVGDDGGPCYAVGVDRFKIGEGAYPNAEQACPANSGTGNKIGMSSILDCQCMPGSTGPNGGPCNPCPSNTWKSSWGPATCNLECPLHSHTEFCDGVGGNTACTSAYQCVCDEGWNGRLCAPGSPQAAANFTCPPCVIASSRGPTGPVVPGHASFNQNQEMPIPVGQWPGPDHREEPLGDEYWIDKEWPTAPLTNNESSPP